MAPRRRRRPADRRLRRRRHSAPRPGTYLLAYGLRWGAGPLPTGFDAAVLARGPAPRRPFGVPAGGSAGGSAFVVADGEGLSLCVPGPCEHPNWHVAGARAVLRPAMDRLVFLTLASLVTVAPQGDTRARPSHR